MKKNTSRYKETSVCQYGFGGNKKEGCYYSSCIALRIQKRFVKISYTSDRRAESVIDKT